MPGRGRDSSGTNAQIDRYDPLTNAARERGWTAESVTIEAGARGFVARTVPRFLKRLGRCKKKINSDCKSISSITARCTYTIYLARDSIDWVCPDGDSQPRSPGSNYSHYQQSGTIGNWMQ